MMRTTSVYKQYVWLWLLLCLAATSIRADKLHLKSGDVLEGTVKRKTSDLILFDDGGLGEIWISRSRVDKIVMEEIEDPNKPRGFIRKLRYRGWASTFDLSIDNSFGNTDEQSNRLAYTLNRRTEKNEFDLDMSYYNKVKRSKVTDNKYTIGSAHRWLKVGRSAFWFLDGRYDYDEFKSWQSRAALHFGPGYSLVKNDKVELRTGLGAGARKEWGSINDNTKFEGYFGFIFDWNIMQGQSLNLDVTYLPVYTDFADYRTRTSFNWRLNLNKQATWSVLLGVLHEYQSIIDPGIKQNDLRNYLGLQIAF